MIKRLTSLLFFLLAVDLGVSVSAQTSNRAIMALPGEGGERRVALVIGNSKYRFSPLRNPANDARAMAKTLENVGFEVILKLDATRREMRRSMIQFGRRLQDGGVGLFYYAGHGVQLYGDNYLIPVGAEIEAEDHVEIEAIELNQVLGRMGGARNRLNIVILDACRNNPFARMFRSATRGLAQTLAPAGTYIAYATAPGDVAEDGAGRNSLYTQALMRWMQRPGLTIENVFKQVRSRVFQETNGKQVPWTSSSITGDFFFLPTRPEKVAGPTPKSPRTDRNPFELAFWNTIQDSRNPSDFRAYLNRFPNGVFTELARNRIAAMAPPPATKKRTPDPPRKKARPDRPRIVAPPRTSAMQEAKPTTTGKPQFAAVDATPKGKSGSGSKSDFSGTWVGADKSWKIRLEVRGKTVEGQIVCPEGETGRSSQFIPQVVGRTETSVRGTIDLQGRVNAETVGSVNYRKLVGTLPNLDLWENGQCGGAEFVMRREGEAPRKALPRVASVDPASPLASTRALSADERRNVEKAIYEYYEGKGADFDGVDIGNSGLSLEISYFHELAILDRKRDTISVRAKYEAGHFLGRVTFDLVRVFTLKKERGGTFTVVKMEKDG